MPFHMSLGRQGSLVDAHKYNYRFLPHSTAEELLEGQPILKYLPHQPTEVSLASFLFFYFFQRFYLFLERGEGTEKERRETSMCGCLSCAPTWDLTHNPDLCPDWKSNPQSFRPQVIPQSLSHTSQGSINPLSLGIMSRRPLVKM